MATETKAYEPLKLNLTPQCVESQEWTYGIDNTGTRFNDVATYCLILSDGSTLEWSQDGSSNSWTPQLIEWSANIQAAADNAGLKWFVEPRFVDNPNPPNIDGTINGPGGTASGLPGAPSVPIAVALVDGGMAWRYVNFQICPGQPVPVRAFRKTSQLYGDGEFELTAAGAVLGPIQEFWVCADCDGKDSGSLLWLKKDPENPEELIQAEDGEIPNCYYPCGTLALTESPPDRTCEFFFSEACDNVNEPDDDANWTNLVTRRATVCQGEQIGVEYFVPDPADESALIPYDLVGEFVDCDTGDVIELPPIECDNPQVKKFWRIDSDGPNGINGERWYANAVPFGTTATAFTGLKEHINGAADEAVVITNNWILNDLDFPATPGFDTSQELYYAWIYLDKPTILREPNGNSGEWLAAYMGGCGQAPRKVAEFGPTTAADSGLGDFIELSPGLYQIAFHVNDFSVYGGIQLQESTDGGQTFTNFPMARTWATQPEISCDCVQICDGILTELDGTVIEFDPNTMSWCEIKCPEIVIPEDTIPDYEFETTDGCDSVDGDQANYVTITRETVFINGTPTTTFYTNYGDEATQAEYTLIGDFVDCATGEIIDDPEPPPCESTSYAGLLWRVKDTAQLLTTVDYWGGPNYPTGQASAPHANVSDIFTVSSDGKTLEHSVGPPSATFTAAFTDIRTSNADFIAASGAGDRTGTSGNDQIRVRGYVVLNETALLRDVNPNTGERGGIWLNQCCAGSLQLIYEDTTDSVPGDTGIFDGVRVPAGIHYFEAVTSDLSAWQGFQLDASFDDGANYEPLPIYDIKPEYECIALSRCDDTGVLLHADTGEVITVGVDDLRCEPPACIAASTTDALLSELIELQKRPMCAKETFYKVTLPEQGTVEQKWEANASPRITTDDSYKTAAFTLTDDCGLPAHANGAADTTVSNTLSQTTNINNPGIPDQAQSDFWIYLDEDSELGAATGQAEASGIWIGCDIKSMSEIQDGVWPNTDATVLGDYAPGIYRVRLYHDDEGTSGTTRLTANGSLIPAYATKPTVEVVKGWCCDDGNFYNLDKSETLDPAEWVCDDPRCKTGCLTC